MNNLNNEIVVGFLVLGLVISLTYLIDSYFNRRLEKDVHDYEIEALKEKAKMYQMGYEYYLNLFNISKGDN